MSIKRIASLIASILFALLALALGYWAYRRIGTPPQLLRSAVTVEGTITEKLTTQERLSPLPLSIPTYTIRYAFPTPYGVMRTGQQTVTRATYLRLGDQGAPATITLSPNDPAINAIDPRITFPGVAALRLAASLFCLLLAYLTFLFGFLSPRTVH
jgi:hypothetical protein